jgi:hypothetical protein
MNAPTDRIARTVLYEGYILYPYRASALKNQHRFAPGGLAPQTVAEPCGEPWFLRAEVLVTGDEKTELSVRARFLHPLARTGGSDPPWHEAVEREMDVPALPLGSSVRARTIDFVFPAARSVEEAPHGRVERVQLHLEPTVELSVVKLAPQVFRATVRVCNLTPCAAPAEREEVALRTLNAAHVVFQVRGGEFVSLTDPPPELCALARDCRNEGVWPVLVGAPGARDTLLAAPIILPDYPRIAPESAGDFFDGTEIDEMLALRVLTLTDAEKREMTATDPRAAALLECVEALPDERLRHLHGAHRSPRAPRPGDRVRLRPRGRADAFDVLLAGRTATVAAVEVDFEGRTHLAVTVDGDPGGDLGAVGRVGHRFFFRPEEVELLADGGAP